MDITSFKRDRSTVQSGQWIKDIPGMGDVELRVRGLSSTVAVALRSRKERATPASDRERDGSLKAEAAMRVLTEVLAEVVLLDWRNITQGGDELPFDPDLAAQWLSDPDMMPFADGVVWAAQVVDKGTAEAEAELAKN